MDNQYEQELQQILPDLPSIGNESAFWFMAGVAWTFRISLHDVLEKLQENTQEYDTLKASHHLLQRKVTALEQQPTTSLVELTSNKIVTAIESNTTKVTELLEKLTLSQIADSAIAKTMLAHNSVVESKPALPMSEPMSTQQCEQRPQVADTLCQTYPDIARAIQNNEGSKAQMAKRFGVSESTIARIKRELKGGAE